MQISCFSILFSAFLRPRKQRIALWQTDKLPNRLHRNLLATVSGCCHLCRFPEIADTIAWFCLRNPVIECPPLIRQYLLPDQSPLFSPECIRNGYCIFHALLFHFSPVPLIKSYQNDIFIVPSLYPILEVVPQEHNIKTY